MYFYSVSCIYLIFLFIVVLRFFVSCFKVFWELFCSKYLLFDWHSRSASCLKISWLLFHLFCMKGHDLLEINRNWDYIFSNLQFPCDFYGWMLLLFCLHVCNLIGRYIKVKTQCLNFLFHSLALGEGLWNKLFWGSHHWWLCVNKLYKLYQFPCLHNTL